MTWRQRSTKKRWRARSDHLDNCSQFVVLDDSVIQAALHWGIPKTLKYVSLFVAGKLRWGQFPVYGICQRNDILIAGIIFQFRHLIHFHLGTLINAPGFFKAGPHDNPQTLWWCCTPPSPWHCCKHLHILTWANLTVELPGAIYLTILLWNGLPSGCWTNTTSECFFNPVHDPQINPKRNFANASQMARDGWSATVANRTTVLSAGICLKTSSSQWDATCSGPMSPSQNVATHLPPKALCQ